MVLEAIKYSRGQLQILDQLRLPHVSHYDEIVNARDAWMAIRAMRVRGAPAIAIVAILALAVELETMHAKGSLSASAAEVGVFVHEKLNYLITARPTAVNLHDAAVKMGKVVDGASTSAEASGQSVKEAFLLAAERMLVDDVRANEAIGKHGAEWIQRRQQISSGSADSTSSQNQVSVLTICNTGSLATAGYGTALGVIRSLHATSALKHAYFLETRPYNQGARLTAYELAHDRIPATLITDSMAAALMRLKAPVAVDNITAVVVGADRVVRDGSTANKIGTYALAILARHHGLRFLIAAPRTSIDLATRSGADIVIEERPAHEMTTIRGPVCDATPSEPPSASGSNAAFLEVNPDHVETVAVAAPGVGVWNPAFDVTPPELIDGIVTEVGVIEKDARGRFEANLEACLAMKNGAE